MTTTEIALPETNVDGLSAVERAGQIVINTNNDYLAADSFCAGLKDLEKQVDAMFDEHIDAAFKAHRALTAKKKKFSEPIQDARKIIKGKLDVYERAQEAIREEQERKLQSEAKKQAEERALAAALAAEKDGDKQTSDAIMQEPVTVPVVAVAKFTPKTQTVLTTWWKFRVTDLMAVPREYLMLDEVKTGQVVRALKAQTKIAGIEAYSERG